MAIPTLFSIYLQVLSTEIKKREREEVGRKEELAPCTPVEGAPRGPQWRLVLPAGPQLWTAGPGGARGMGGAGGRVAGGALPAVTRSLAPPAYRSPVPPAAVGAAYPRVGRGTPSASLPTALSL